MRDWADDMPRPSTVLTEADPGGKRISKVTLDLAFLQIDLCHLPDVAMVDILFAEA